jgi:aspartyl-tRNA(Asn)/glutamyl-tRNA(Gln) amidotransferase subunit A
MTCSLHADSAKGLELWDLSASELVAGYLSGDFTPLDAVESVLKRIDRVNSLLNAVVTQDAEGARIAATESTLRYQQGNWLGPMDGVPITVKDNILVQGMRSTWGSFLFEHYIPERDELPIARLRRAGAIILGKTNCPEFTLQGYTDNTLFGTTRNPWNLALTPGGSSGGAAAAVAAGLGPIAIGTDGGGSIRRPASHTGLIGLKPSRGRVPRMDGFPAILLDFETVGPITRSVADVKLVMDVIGTFDPNDPASALFRNQLLVEESGGPYRILFVPQFGDSPVDVEIAAAVDSAAIRLLNLGHRVEMGPAPFDISIIDKVWPVVSKGGLAWLCHISSEFSQKASRPMIDLANEGSGLSAADYIGALTSIKQLERQLSHTFETYDLIMTPSAAALPWKAEQVFPSKISGQAVGPRGHAVFTAFVNLIGASGINLPCGNSESGLPIGLQLVARPGADCVLMTIAAQCETAGLWTITRPNQILPLNRALDSLSS